MWPTGFSWTSTHIQEVENQDGSKATVMVQGGPFLYVPNFLGVELYAGMRPTSPWTHGGNEGILVWFKRLMQKIGWSNLGFALRWAK